MGVARRGRDRPHAAARDVPCSDKDPAPGSTAIDACLFEDLADPEAIAALANPSESWPSEVRVVLVVVEGPAGGELLREQAATVVRALRWFADHRSDRHRERPCRRAQRRPGSPQGAGRPDVAQGVKRSRP